MKHDVFISYSSQNKNVADAICHVLEEHRIKCWIAPRDIPGGADYGDLIDDAIKNCRLFIIVFSKSSSLSQWVKGELNLAFSEGKHIIPYRIDETPLKGSMRLILNQTHWIDSFPDAEEKFKDLVEVASNSLGINLSPATPASADNVVEPEENEHETEPTIEAAIEAAIASEPEQPETETVGAPITTDSHAEKEQPHSFPKKPVIIGVCIAAVIALAVSVPTFMHAPSSAQADSLVVAPAIDTLNKNKAAMKKRKSDTPITAPAVQPSPNTDTVPALPAKNNLTATPTQPDNMPTPAQASENTVQEQAQTPQQSETTTLSDTCTAAAEKSSEKKKENGAETVLIADSLFQTGQQLYNAKNYAEAVKWYRQAAEQGHAAAQNNLGNCYYNGRGVTKNPDEAVAWWGKAAEQGYAAAQYNLGNCYYNGQGVTKDLDKAAAWWGKAAKQGNSAAQYSLGNCYCFGEGVKQNDNKAVKWWRKAAEQGHAAAQYNLGVSYSNQGNYAEAIKWYRKAAEQGNAGAQQKLKETGESW